MFSGGPSPLGLKIRFLMHARIILNSSFPPREEGWQVSVKCRSEPTNHAARTSRVSGSPQEAHSLALSGTQGHQALFNRRCCGDRGRTNHKDPVLVALHSGEKLGQARALKPPLAGARARPGAR